MQQTVKKPRHYIREWAEFSGKTPTDIIKATGADKSLVSRWFNQGVLPKDDYLEQIATEVGTDRGGLLNRPPRPEPVRTSEDPAAPDHDAELPAGDGVSTLKPYEGTLPGASPDIDVSAGAGPGGLPLPASLTNGGVIYSADAIRGEILLPQYLLSEFTRAKSPRVHWVTVRGDSMTPTLQPGERVMVDTTDTAIGQGGVFVLRDPDGEVLVKRLRKLEAGRIEVVSDNERQGNSVHDAEAIAIIGRVVGRLGRL